MRRHVEQPACLEGLPNAHLSIAHDGKYDYRRCNCSARQQPRKPKTRCWISTATLCTVHRYCKSYSLLQPPLHHNEMTHRHQTLHGASPVTEQASRWFKTPSTQQAVLSSCPLFFTAFEAKRGGRMRVVKGNFVDSHRRRVVDAPRSSASISRVWPGYRTHSCGCTDRGAS